MRAIGWHAWYTDNREFDSKHIAWDDLPSDGLAIVVVFMGDLTPEEEPGTYTQTYHGYDYYWTIPGTPLEVFYAHDDPKGRYPGASVKRGKWMPTEEFEQYAEDARKMKVRPDGDS